MLIAAVISILIILMPIKVYYSALLSEPQLFIIVKLYNIVKILDNTISLEGNNIHFKGTYNHDFEIKDLLNKPKWLFLLKAINAPIVNVYTYVGGQYDFSTAIIGVWNVILTTISGIVLQKGTQINYYSSLSPDTESYICAEGIISSSIFQFIIVIFTYIGGEIWNTLVQIKFSR